jgi:hypothetical protein
MTPREIAEFARALAINTKDKHRNDFDIAIHVTVDNAKDDSKFTEVAIRSTDDLFYPWHVSDAKDPAKGPCLATAEEVVDLLKALRKGNTELTEGGYRVGPFNHG